jgi:hypothetical protein
MLRAELEYEATIRNLQERLAEDRYALCLFVSLFYISLICDILCCCRAEFGALERELQATIDKLRKENKQLAVMAVTGTYLVPIYQS